MNGYCPNCQRETEQKEIVNQPYWLRIKNCLLLTHLNYRECDECGEDFEVVSDDYDPLAEAFDNLKQAYESRKFIEESLKKGNVRIHLAKDVY